MSEYRDDALVTETLERIRRAELATVLYPAGTPEHARAVERLERASRQMRRLSEAAAEPDSQDAWTPSGSVHEAGEEANDEPRELARATERL